MLPLSLNWKRLSSKLGRAKGKIEKPKRKFKRKITEKEVAKHETKDGLSNKPHTIIDKSPTSSSVIETVLWNFEGELSLENFQQAKNMKMAISNSDRELKKKETGKFLAIDCEFVGVGPEGIESVLARVSIVNYFGHLIYDKFVLPQEKVTDWRTWVSGVTPDDMKDASSFKDVQKEVAEMFEGRILVGHSIDHDLEALLLSHPASMIRDTSRHGPFREVSKGKTPGLKKLIKHFFDYDIQSGLHSSIEDSRATMLLYRKDKGGFEKERKSRKLP